MRCRKCGRMNPDNIKNCLYCGNRLDPAASGGKHGKKDNTDKFIIMAIIVIAAVFLIVAGIGIYKYHKAPSRGYHIGGGGGYASVPAFEEVPDEDADTVLARIAELNNGELPELTYDDTGIISFIDGQYTERNITDYASAIQSLNDIKPLLQIQNPGNEYIGKEMYKCDENKLYKLQQVVNGVPVYSKECIVETDANGKTVGFMGDYDPGIEIDTAASYSKANAESKALEESGAAQVYGSDLYVYTIDGDPALVWSVDVGDDIMITGKYFISAIDGSLVDTETMVSENAVNATGIDMKNREREFKVSNSGTGYVMHDKTRGIKVYECGNSASGQLVSSNNNVWTNPAAVSAMGNVSQIVDYYTNVLKTNAYDSGQLSRIDVYVNYKPISCTSEHYANAFSTTDNNSRGTVLAYGNADTYVSALDVTAHEYTHSIISATCDLKYLNQSGAINEAYADIIGNLIQNNIYNSEDWTIGEELNSGAIRSLSNPKTYNQPEKVNGRHMHNYCNSRHDHSKANCDNGGVHTNSGIINKAAYLMHTKGFDNKLELANLFSRSMNYMTSTSDFKNCRAALIHSARTMNLDASKLDIISQAFSEVGIVNEAHSSFSFQKGIVSGRIADAISRNPLREAEIKAVKSDSSNGGGTAYSDVDGSFNLKLAGNTYKLTISAAGYRSAIVNDVVVYNNDATYLENTILLTEIEGNPMSRAGGCVTNAVSGESVSDASIQFREEWGNKTGEYIKNGQGNTLALSTNANGDYYTADLPYGYYTAEVSREGYVTQYVNIIATPDSEASLGQNIVLAPETSGDDFRITLEWDEDPRDEDAHIKGDKPENFHVYYQNKTASIDNRTIATLDHDDVNGNGFETVTLNADHAGTYQYYVHHYAGNGSLSTSNAKVKVYQGDVMVKQYNVPVDRGAGRYWHVFTIVNGDIVSVNEITDNDPS